MRTPFSLKIAIPRWIYGAVIGFALTVAVQQKWLQQDQATMIAGLLAAFGVDVSAWLKSSKGGE